MELFNRILLPAKVVQILMNARRSDRCNLEGLAHLISRMKWYCALAEHLPSLEDVSNYSTTHEAHQRYQDLILGLYRSVLLFQMKTAWKFSPRQGLSSRCDLVNLDDFDADLRRIEGAECSLQAVSENHRSQRIKDHLSTIFKAAAQGRARLGNVELNLKDFVTAQMMKNIDEEEKNALQALHILDPRYDMDDIEDEKDRLLDEAYEWILDTPEYIQFTDWRRGESNTASLMWVKGDAGTGKTML
jgi:hypothetical protein